MSITVVRCGVSLISHDVAVAVGAVGYLLRVDVALFVVVVLVIEDTCVIVVVFG